MSSQAFNTRDTPQRPSARGCSPFQLELVALMPHLRAISRKLCGGQPLAEDMAQETLMKAWRARDHFEPGTNLKAWLFTILRNEISSHARRAWRETRWDSDKGERIAAAPNQQEWTLELFDTARALLGLPQCQREAVLVVGAGGLSYDDSAKICGVAAGTMKSRVARGRAALRRTLESDMPQRQYAPPSTCGASNDILVQLSSLTRTDQPHGARSLR